MNKMKGAIIVVLLTLAFLIPPTHAEENIDCNYCYAGSHTLFHKSKEMPMVASWAQNGIIMSNDKRFNNMTVHCEGVQIGGGKKREGYHVCTWKDDEGDIIIVGGPFGGKAKFLFGSGKWKGIKSSYLKSQRIVRSKPFKGAMPGTHQGCRNLTGTFELPPK